MALKAPTPPTPPTPPALDGNKAVPEIQVDSYGPSVPAGEIHTPAEKFGIHINIGGSQAAPAASTEAEPAEAAEPATMTVEQKIKSDAKATKEKMQQMAVPQAKEQQQPDRDKENATEGLSQESMVPVFGGSDNDGDRQATEGSLKIAPHDDGFFDMIDGGSISYWPFLLVFVAAFSSFILMNFMKKRRKDDDFGSLSYQKKQAVQEYAKVQKEVEKEISATPIKPIKPLPKKKKQDEQPHFEIRI